MNLVLMLVGIALIYCVGIGIMLRILFGLEESPPDRQTLFTLCMFSSLWPLFAITAGLPYLIFRLSGLVSRAWQTFWRGWLS